MELADQVIRTLQVFKNVVLEGPPGTGKTYVVDEVAEHWESVTGRPVNRGDVSSPLTMTLHPSTTYEEFVEGLRYSSSKKRFTLQPGFMQRLVTLACDSPDEDFLVLLDEINRANVPKVFGDLLLSMEASKRAHHDGGGWVGGTALSLAYSGGRFVMPDNVYLLGTMNTSDRSIAPLDSALRRRFGFIRVEPLQDVELTAALTATQGAQAAAALAESVKVLSTINRSLRLCVGPDAQLGHSYLFGVSVLPDGFPHLLDADGAGARQETFWTESIPSAVATGTQFQLPEKQWTEMLLTSIGAGVDIASLPTAKDQGLALVVEYDGHTYDHVTIERKSAGQTQCQISGRPESPPLPIRKFSSGLVLLRVTGEKSLALTHVPAGDALLADGRVLDVLREQSKAVFSGGRECGVISGGRVAAALSSERTVWQYAILPQLIETLTQSFASDLMTSSARSAWIEANVPSTEREEAANGWLVLEGFLAARGLRVVMEGNGITRALSVVSDVPAGPTALPAPTSLDADSEPAVGTATTVAGDAIESDLVPATAAEASPTTPPVNLDG